MLPTDRPGRNLVPGLPPYAWPCDSQVKLRADCVRSHQRKGVCSLSGNAHGSTLRIGTRFKVPPCASRRTASRFRRSYADSALQSCARYVQADCDCAQCALALAIPPLTNLPWVATCMRVRAQVPALATKPPFLRCFVQSGLPYLLVVSGAVCHPALQPFWCMLLQRWRFDFCKFSGTASSQQLQSRRTLIASCISGIELASTWPCAAFADTWRSTLANCPRAAAEHCTPAQSSSRATLELLLQLLSSVPGAPPCQQLQKRPPAGCSMMWCAASQQEFAALKTVCSRCGWLCPRRRRGFELLLL